jgi:hypothetical protein
MSEEEKPIVRQPLPQFILFLRDEVIGLVRDAEALRRQWRYKGKA